MLRVHAHNVTSHVKVHNKYTLCPVDKSQGIYILAVSVLDIAYTTFGPGTTHPDSDWHNENNALVIFPRPRNT